MGGVDSNRRIRHAELNPVMRLLAIEEIKSLKARYCRYIDTRDWEGFRSVFSDDCRFDFSEAMGELTPAVSVTRPDSADVDAVVAAMKLSLNGVLTIHHGHMPEIEITSASSARGIWAMYDYVQRPAGTKALSIEGFGHYHETYARCEGTWRISSLRLSRISVRAIDPRPNG